MKRSKYNGWIARRRSRREQDRFAQSEGFRNARDRKHKLAVERLLLILDSYSSWDESTELFGTRVVADAIASSTKVIRTLAHAGLLEAEKLSTERVRKLFFRAGSVNKYLALCRAFTPAHPWYRGFFRNERIAVDRRLLNGELATKELAGAELKLSTRGIQRLIRSGALETHSIGRTKFILRRSLVNLSRKRSNKAYLRCILAQDRFESAKKNLKRICGDGAIPVDAITKARAAVELGVSKSRVECLIKSGALKAFELGNMTFIRREDMDKLPANLNIPRLPKISTSPKKN